MYKNYFKRIIDIVVSFSMLLILSPFLLLVTIGLFFVNQGNPFFLQARPGKDEKIFTVIKFKTMNDKKDFEGNLLSDEKRLTKLGSFIRSSSVDELPQILNVLVGHMSLIGPRPLLKQYLPLYTSGQSRRHEIRPGITGWAQVNGRNAISWKQKFELDVWYVDNISLLLDIKIISRTIRKVFKREDINSATFATMEAFNGKN